MPLLFVFVLFLMACDQRADQAKTCLDLGDYARAERLYEPLLDQNPASLEYRTGYALALFSQAKLVSDSSRCPAWQKADQALTLLAGLDSSSKVKKMWAEAQIGRADCEIDGARMSQALDLLDLALKLDSSNLDALDLKAFVHENTGDWQLASQDYKQILALDSNSIHSIAGLARAKLMQKDSLGAMDEVIRGLKMDSTDQDLQSLWNRITE